MNCPVPESRPRGVVLLPFAISLVSPALPKEPLGPMTALSRLPLQRHCLSTAASIAAAQNYKARPNRSARAFLLRNCPLISKLIQILPPILHSLHSISKVLHMWISLCRNDYGPVGASPGAPSGDTARHVIAYAQSWQRLPRGKTFASSIRPIWCEQFATSTVAFKTLN